MITYISYDHRTTLVYSPSSSVSALAAAALTAAASSSARSSARRAIWAFALASTPTPDWHVVLEAWPLGLPKIRLRMKSNQLQVLYVNNHSPVPPGKGCLGPLRIQLEDLEDDICKYIVVERAIYTGPPLLRADRKPRLLWSYPQIEYTVRR